MVSFTLNGKPTSVDCDPNTPLLWVLRDIIGLTGTKYGCGIEVCHACTVLIDGSAEKSCHIPVLEIAGKRITTIEGLSPDGSHPVQRAWIEAAVPQCGYCQSGMILRASKLVGGNSKPTDAQIDAAIGNICVCGTYQRVKVAIKRATGQMV